MGKRVREDGHMSSSSSSLAKKKRRSAEQSKHDRDGAELAPNLESARTEIADSGNRSNEAQLDISVDRDEKSEKELKRERKKKKKRKLEQGQTHNLDTAKSQRVGKDEQQVDNGMKQPPQQYEQSSALSGLTDGEIQHFLSSNFISISGNESSLLRPILQFEYLPSDCRHASIFESFKSPTPIQTAAWPYLLSGRDVVGIAETGSGKTLAFGVPCVRHVRAKQAQSSKKASKIRAVIISPTRELAMQSHEQMSKLVADTDVKVVCVYGGVPKDPQRAALATSQIVIATPGRLMDFLNEGSADLSNVSMLVLDEADRMLDKGFEQDIRTIVSSVPTGQTQTAMFTATWPSTIRELADQFFKDPIKITIGDNPTGDLRANARVTQNVEVVDPRGKETRLLQLLKQYQSGKSKNDRILVFCLYKKEATRIENFIRAKGFRVAGIHGDMTQSARTGSLDGFRDGSVPLLVATDVAARGLDIPAVKCVINVTFPLTAEDYVHRIGRTGRAGEDGLAVTLFTEHDKGLSGALINVLRAAKQPVPDELLKFGGTVKKKSHDAYGAFYKDTEGLKQATKITFN